MYSKFAAQRKPRRCSLVLQLAMAYRGYYFVVVIIVLANPNLCLVPFGATALSFQYDFSVDLQRADLLFLNDSFADDGRISLTKMAVRSAGRVAYAQPVRLWDCWTGKTASFSTSFSFAIGGNHNSTRGDGMAFFIGPFPPAAPPDSFAGFLGLYNNPAHTGSPPVVAVEFDTFWNPELDPPLPSGVSDHVGIDINSIHSTSYTTDLKNLSLYGTMSTNITYDAGSKMVAVSLQLADGSTHSVEAPVDFRAAGLPQDVAIGFSAATGLYWESHQVLSWSFNSTDMADPSCNTKRWAIPVISAEGACLAAAVLYIVIVDRLRARRYPLETPSTELSRHGLPETATTNGTTGISLPETATTNGTTGISLPAPREFLYQQLSAATDDFSSHRKLGEGAFGEVYRGDLPGQLKVAVKRLTMQSERTRRDYVNEIMTLGQLHHRNMVKLVGWCDDGGEHLLLVYELMENRSVDRYLHGPESLLTWSERYKIVLGVGYAIEYLHTGCPNAILHRDIKPSNVMLDDGFEAKLGDFGLVRQVPRQGYLRGTTMIGSTDYIDPVCIIDRTATAASDMYSFGVLLLEVATGKDPAAMREEVGGRPDALIHTVRDSYARGTVHEVADPNLNDWVHEVADPNLNGNFIHWQMERVLVVGLLCVQSDRHDRPSIREAVCMLSNSGHPLPVVRV